MTRWIQTYRGRQFWPLAPDAEDVEIEDIAHALAMKCRFSGHTARFYSVAQHSVHVAGLLAGEPAWVQLCGLMHDSAEAYLPDVARPIKAAMPGFAAIERCVEAAIAQRFDLPFFAEGYPWPAVVKKADDAILVDEARQVMGPAPVPWNLPFAGAGIAVPDWDWRRAEAEFLAAFERLDMARRAGA